MKRPKLLGDSVAAIRAAAKARSAAGQTPTLENTRAGLRALASRLVGYAGEQAQLIEAGELDDQPDLKEAVAFRHNDILVAAAMLLGVAEDDASSQALQTHLATKEAKLRQQGAYDEP